MKNTRKKGFTIVELVIVIAVIAILAAVLIPTFSNVISSAKESSAKSEARNLWVQYTAANAETFADVNGYIRVAKSDKPSTDGDNDYYYFEIKNGQINTDAVTWATANTAPTTTETGKEYTAKPVDSGTYENVYVWTLDDKKTDTTT